MFGRPLFLYFFFFVCFKLLLFLSLYLLSSTHTRHLMPFVDSPRLLVLTISPFHLVRFLLLSIVPPLIIFIYLFQSSFSSFSLKYGFDASNKFFSFLFLFPFFFFCCVSSFNASPMTAGFYLKKSTQTKKKEEMGKDRRAVRLVSPRGKEEIAFI